MGIQLPQAPCGSIARVGKGLFTGFQGPFVELAKTLFGHENFAPDLELFGPALAAQSQGNGAQGADIGGNVLPGLTVTTGRRLYQQAAFVGQADGKSVQLGLHAENEVLMAQTLGDAATKVGKIVCAESIIQ